MTSLHPRFGLTLMVNHACNLRCRYCYTGAKRQRPMPLEIGRTAIDRAFDSLVPKGELDVSFFGGEPLLEASRIMDWMRHARIRSAEQGRPVHFQMTTNGTLTHGEAWRVMTDEDMDLVISLDGPPEVHDRHRQNRAHEGTALMVEATVRRLLADGHPVRVNAVVCPDTVEQLPGTLAYFQGLGLQRVDLSLDLWADWTVRDGLLLEEALRTAARVWRKALPDLSVNLFDGKAAALAGLPVSHASTRCGFGVGEVAVAPSGRMYPCERLIGEDPPDHSLRLAGNVMDIPYPAAGTLSPFQFGSACDGCTLRGNCDATCRCGNFFRTGNPLLPDGLLCLLNKAVTRAVIEVMAPDGDPNLPSFVSPASKTTTQSNPSHAQ